MDTQPMMSMVAALVLCGSIVRADDTKVDVALVLAADVSGSMSGRALEMQRQGFAAAFRHPDVLTIIGGGAYGSVAVTYVEWAGPVGHWVTVPWTIISDRASAGAFADELVKAPKQAGGPTSVSMALLFAAAQFRFTPADALRQTIDISGNGPNNAGPPVAGAREFVVNMGITINGLTFPENALSDVGPYAYMFGGPDIDLDRYYEDCVIGGAGGFAMSIDGPGGFIAAIRRKVTLEIAGLPGRIEYADYSSGHKKRADCANEP